MIKKIIFCFLVMICLSGCGKKQRFIERCTQNDLSYNICECMYTEVSQQIEDTDGFIEWFVAANKKDDTMEDIMRGATYAGFLSNMVLCTLSDTVFNIIICCIEKASDEDIKSLAKTMADFMDSL